MTPRIDRRLKRGACLVHTSLIAAVAAASTAPAGASPSPAPPEGPRIFRLPAEPMPQALERFAAQARVSVGLAPGAGCTGTSRSLSGSMTAAAALQRLLPDGCRAERLDPRSFVVFGPPRPTAAAAAPRRIPPPPLDELIVTAERRPEALGRATYAVSALDREELRRLGGGSLQDVATQLVGVTVTNLGSGRNKIFIRGLSDGSFTGATQSTVGLYLDDTPITYDAPDPDLRLVDIDRVEVLRGPQGTLYGSGSIGGVVRYVTAKPDPLAFGGEVTGYGGLTEHGAPSAGLDAWLNLPLLDGNAALRGVSYWEDRGGYLDNPRLGLSNVNDSRRAGGRLEALARLQDGWELGASVSHQSINARDAQYTDGAGQLTRDTALREPHDNDFTHLSASLSRNGAADVKVTGAYVDHQLDTRYDASTAFSAASPPSAVDEGQHVKMWLAEATLSGERGRTNGLAGLFVSGAEEMDAALLSPGAAAARQLYARRDRHAEAALYGEATIALSKRIAVTAGGRLFAQRLTTHAEGPDPRAPSATFSASRTDQGFAGKLRISYAWSPSLAIYAQAQDGYRPGGFNIPGLASLDPVALRIPIAFEPDRMRSYEIGGEVPLLRGALGVRWDIFHADWRRIQSDQFVAAGLPVTVNIGDGANTGIEAEAQWMVGARLQMRAAVMLDDPQLTRTRHVLPAQPDVGLPGAPSETASLDLRYRWRLGSAEATVSAQSAYVGRSYLSFAGEAASSMGGYATARLQGDLTAAAWRMSAWVENLTDTRADTFAFGNPFSRPLSRQATPLRPRTLTVSIGRTF